MSSKILFNFSVSVRLISKNLLFSIILESTKSLYPPDKSSIPITSKPLSSKYLDKCAPSNPATPVITIFFPILFMN